MGETTETLVERLGVQGARYRHAGMHRCDACRKHVSQALLVRGKVQTRKGRPGVEARYRSRQVCHFCMPAETPWPGGVVALDTVPAQEDQGGGEGGTV